MAAVLSTVYQGYRYVSERLIIVNMCGPGRVRYASTRSEVREEVETEVVHSSANGLNRTMSVENGQSLSATLDEPGTNKKSLCDRVGCLWLVREIITLFKKLFYLMKSIGSVGEMTVPVVASTGKSADASAICARRIDLLLKDVRDLGERVAIKHLSLDELREADALVKEFSLKLAQLEAAIKGANGENDLDKEIIKIKDHICWLGVHIGAILEKGHCLCCDRNYYDDLVYHRYAAARLVLKGNSQKLVELGTLLTVYKQVADACTAKRTQTDDMAERGTIMFFELKQCVITFTEAVSKLVSDAGKLEEYQEETAKWPAVVSRIFRAFDQAMLVRRFRLPVGGKYPDSNSIMLPVSCLRMYLSRTT